MSESETYRLSIINPELLKRFYGVNWERAYEITRQLLNAEQEQIDILSQIQSISSGGVILERISPLQKSYLDRIELKVVLNNDLKKLLNGGTSHE